MERDFTENDDEETELEDTVVEAGYERFGVTKMNPNPRPSGSHEVLENSVKTKTDAVVVESDHENFSEKKRSELETEGENSEAVDDAEFWDREEEICYERFGVAEMKEIIEDTMKTDISEEGQSDWSLEECQELLAVEISVKVIIHGSVEEHGELG